MVGSAQRTAEPPRALFSNAAPTCDTCDRSPFAILGHARYNAATSADG